MYIGTRASLYSALRYQFICRIFAMSLLQTHATFILVSSFFAYSVDFLYRPPFQACSARPVLQLADLSPMTSTNSAGAFSTSLPPSDACFWLANSPRPY